MHSAQVNPWTSSQERSTVAKTKCRGILIGVAVVAVLVVAVVVSTRTSQPSRIGKHVRLTSKSNSDECRERLRQLAGRMNGMTANEMYEKFDIGQDAMFGYMDENGKSMVVPLTSHALHAVQPHVSFDAKHKWVRLGKTKRMLLYPNNMAVSLDVNTCRVQGLYMPFQSQFHPAVDKMVPSHIRVAANAPPPSPSPPPPCHTTQYLICQKWGVLCREYYVFKPGYKSCWPGQGWMNTHKVYHCGCGHNCNTIPMCTTVLNYGTQCPFSRSHQPCQTTQINQLARHTSKAIKWIGVGLNIASMIASITNPYLGTVGSVVLFSFGFVPKGPSPTSVYKKAMTQLQHAELQMRTCMTQKIAMVYVAIVETHLKTISTNLAPSVFGASNASSALLTHIFNPNTQDCMSIGSLMFVLSTPSQLANVNGALTNVLPYAVKTMQLCMTNYAGTIAAMKEQQNTAGMKIVQAQYKALAHNIRQSLIKSLLYLAKYWNTNVRCKYFHFQFDLMYQKNTYLHNYVFQPVDTMHYALYSQGVLLTRIVALGDEISEPVPFEDAKVFEYKNTRVDHKNEIGRIVHVTSSTACLHECADMDGDCAGVDIKTDSKAGDVLCRLFREKERAKMALEEQATSWVHYAVVYGDMDRVMEDLRAERLKRRK